MAESRQYQSALRRPSALHIRWRGLMASQHLPAILAALSMVLVLPSLFQGWVADDLMHRQILLTNSLPAALKGLFVFVDPGQDLQLVDLSIDLGSMPWWTVDSLRVAFFRPLTVLTHWLDYQLWPDAVPLMHLQSILWFGGTCALATLVYRRLMGDTQIAGLAAFLFAMDAVHLGPAIWLSNRNGQLAVFFGLLTLMAHERWRREGWRAGGLVAPVLLALAVLSAEAGVAAGAYVLAYAMLLDRGTWRRRLTSLLPYAAVGGLWKLVHQRLGYGAWGTGFYLDPVLEPTRFAAAVLERGPILLFSQWIGQVPMLYNLLSLPASRVVWLVATSFIAITGVALIPLVRDSRTARFWALGMLLAIVPACSIRLLGGRLLPIAGFGAMGLMAQFIGAVLDRAPWLPARPAWRSLFWALCLFLVGIHAVLPFVTIPVATAVPGGLQATIAQVIDIGPLPEAEGQDVVIINVPSPYHLIYVPDLRRVSGQPMPAHLRPLAPGYCAVDVTRLGARVLRVRPACGYLATPGLGSDTEHGGLPAWHVAYMYQHLDRFFRGNAFPMDLGHQVALTGMRVEVAALTPDGRPSEARLEFDRPLEDQSLRWLRWDWETSTYVPFTPPAIGQTAVVPGPF